MKLTRRLQAWLVRRHPGIYFRGKGLRATRLPEDREFLEVHARLLETGECLCTLAERYNLWMLARRTRALPGALAEVGVFRGGSAFILAAAKGDATLHLFDTFAGLPAHDATRDGAFRAGQLAETSLPLVQARLAEWSGLEFHAGFFPASAADLPPETRFKLVHLDVDLHRSTRDGLDYFAPRLVPGGVIIVHDYNDPTVPGTRQAVDEFLAAEPAWAAIELWETQVLLHRRG